MHYRPEIDGLRSFAVLPVILSHIQFAGFSGGYVGVDIFFVISGYLITMTILNDLEQGQFSYLRFVERRARRILPALFFVLICSFILLWFIATPGPFKGYSKSLIAAALSVSNFYFLDTIDYFAPAATEIPLLHTWSLAVEEQFYILFPLVFIFIGSSYKRVWTLSAVALSSFTLCLIGARYFPAESYYLLPTRAWELLTGALLAVTVRRRGQWRNEIFSLLGLALIVGPSVLYHEGLPFPSIYTVVPVLGAALVLGCAGPDGISGAILSSAPLRFIGKLSFSAYLWHQVVFVAWRLAGYDDSPYVNKMTLITVVFVLAVLTYYFVETPIRYAKVSGKSVAAATVTVGGICVALGAWGVFENGLAWRMPQRYHQFYETLHWDTSCLHIVRNLDYPLPVPGCAMEGSSTSLKVVLWGDSLASSIGPALRDMLKEEYVDLVQLSYASCAPILGVRIDKHRNSQFCDRVNERVFEKVVSLKPDVVILSAAWAHFLNRSNFVVDGRSQRNSTTTVQQMRNRLDETIEKLTASGITVFLVASMGYPTQTPGDAMGRRMATGHAGGDVAVSISEFQQSISKANQLLALPSRSGVYRVEPSQSFCRERCFYGEAGVMYLADRVHYTRAGADKIAGLIYRQFVNLGILPCGKGDELCSK